MPTKQDPRGRKPKRKATLAPVHPDLGDLTAPPELKGAALAEWHRITPLLAEHERVTPLDVGVLARYCQARADWAESVEMYATLADAVVKTPKGGYVVHPIARMRYRIAGEMRECEKTLGLSPLAREKLTPPEKQSEKMSGLLKFMEAGFERKNERAHRA